MHSREIPSVTGQRDCGLVEEKEQMNRDPLLLHCSFRFNKRYALSETILTGSISLMSFLRSLLLNEAQDALSQSLVVLVH